MKSRLVLAARVHIRMHETLMEINKKCIYRDYGDCIVLYHVKQRRYLVFEDTNVDFFRYMYIGGLSCPAVIANICDMYDVPEKSLVEKDIANFEKTVNSFLDISTFGGDSQDKEHEIEQCPIFDWMAEREIPFSATLEITDVCNMECVHCYRGEKRRTYWTSETFSQALEDLRKLGTLHLTLTGGEIFLHPEILAFLQIASKMDFTITLQTNGSLLTREIVDQLSKLNIREVYVSLYAVQNDINDAITQREMSATKTMKGIQFLCDAGIMTSINCPIMKQNSSSLDGVKKYADKMGIRVNFAPKIIPSQTGKDIVGLNVCDEAFIASCMRNPSIQLYQDKMAAIRAAKPRDHYCQTGFRSITFDAQGNLIICNAFRKICGTLKEESAEKLWHNSSELNSWRTKYSLVRAKCKKCTDYGYCEPCPAHYYTLTRKMDAIDDATCRFGHDFAKADRKDQKTLKGVIQ